MTRIPRLFIKTSMLYFILGSLLGASIELSQGFKIGWPYGVFITTHYHMQFLGFIIQMIMGVAYWMFPRPKPMAYTDRLAITVYAILNTGLAIRFVAGPVFSLTGNSWAGYLYGIAGLLQVIAVLLFIYTIWGRVWMPAVSEAALQKRGRIT